MRMPASGRSPCVAGNAGAACRTRSLRPSPASGALRRRRGQTQRHQRRLECRAADRHGHERAVIAMHLLAQQVRHLGNDRERHLAFQRLGEPFGSAAFAEAMREQSLDRIGMLGALWPDGVVRICRRVGNSHHGTERVPLLCGRNPDADPSLAATEHTDGIGAGKAIDAPATARPLRALSGVRFRSDDIRLVQADGEAPRAAIARQQSRHRGDEACERAEDVGLMVDDRDRPLLRPDRVHHAGQRAACRIRRDEIAVRPAFAEPRYGDHHEIGIGRTQIRMCLRIQWPRIEQHIGIGQRCPHCIIAVGNHAALVGIEPGEVGTLLPTVPDIHQRWLRASRIAARWFELHHIGTEIGEDLAAICHRRSGAQFHHAIRREWHASGPLEVDARSGPQSKQCPDRSAT
jgi:hypothetical protein